MEKTDQNRMGRLFVVSAPSGAGKTTLCNALLRAVPQITYSISTTTRPKRDGEREGVDYFFVSEKAFKKGIEKKNWIEWARVHDNFYGTSAEFVDTTLRSGRNLLLDIDVQGAAQIIKRYPDAITIFILPPSMEVLENRLKMRGSDDPDVIGKRMANAKKEMDAKGKYRHLIVNDDLETAIHRFIDLIKGYLKS